MKNYCTQNGGDCSTCSLVNYDRDCMNNPVSAATDPEIRSKADALALLSAMIGEAEIAGAYPRIQDLEALRDWIRK